MSRLQQKILIKRCSGTRAAILWPLVLYSLIQLASNLLPTTTNSSSFTNINNSPLTRPQFSAGNLQIEPVQQCQTTTTNGRALKTTSSLKLCSSTAEISSTTPLLYSFSPPQHQSLLSSSSSSPSTYLHSLLKIFNLDFGLNRIFSGSKLVLLAEASYLRQYQPNQDKGIIVLNSTNFNTELIQHKHPFPHLKLIEYYVAFCRVCAKFKATYTKLAKEIYPWRNVIRPSAIDLSISTNSPIAHSWSVETVPTMRIHPPPDSTLAEQLDKQLSLWTTRLNQSELQQNMFSEYSSANLIIHKLDVLQYMDKVSLLKSDLVHYIERYVNDSKPSELPKSWPNLKPVTETSLLELYRNHPRQELFLIIESPELTSVSDQSSGGSGGISSAVPLGLHIMLELSSRAPWKAIRYVRATDNRALIEDVITQQKRVVSEQSASQIVEQVELLNNLLSNNNNNQTGGSNNSNNILLVHVDGSHSLTKTEALASTFPFMTIVTSKDLLAMEQSITVSGDSAQPTTNLQNEIKYERAAKRRAINHVNRDRRALFGSLSSTEADHTLNNMSIERKIEIFALYIRQTYTETSEDREFVKAINNFDENSRLDSTETLSTSTTTSSSSTTTTTTTTSASPDKPSQNSNSNGRSVDKSIELNSNKPTTKSEEKDSQNWFKEQGFLKWIPYSNKFLWFLGSPDNDTYKGISSASSSSSSSYSSYCDYEDKLKAIRYLLFNEIPRASIIDKSLKEQQEKLSIIVNLITVIKSYFPLPDLSSIQFIDGVQNYLIKQQNRLAIMNINQETGGVSSSGISSVGFDTRAFKQELKRLESEDKRLPEVKEWKHCAGYPCALWRLFHTLSAFEYKKFIQILHPTKITPQLLSSQTSSSTGLILSDNILSPSVGAITMNSTTNSNGPPSPVERLVSPPSTTTSLSLTIVAPSTSTSTSTSSQQQQVTSTDSNSNNKQPLNEADLPTPVILVMRDYITTFFSCSECSSQFRLETADLNLERIRQQEPAEFSILWLWETHNRVNKRLSVDVSTNPPDRPKVWFPAYDKCVKCYKKPPSYLQDLATSVVDASMFHESIEWNRQEVLRFLLDEYTMLPMESNFYLFEHDEYGFRYVIVAVLGFLLLSVITIMYRCTTYYIERQRRHKATLLNGNGAHYSLELH